MPSGMRFSSASGSLPRRSLAASSRTSPPSTVTPTGTTPRPSAASMSPPRPTATWTDSRPPAACGWRRSRPSWPCCSLSPAAAAAMTPTSRSSGPGTARSASPTRWPQEQRILNQRARAIRDNDLDLFLKRVNHRDAGLMARQRRYFKNLVQLPLADVQLSGDRRAVGRRAARREVGRRRPHPAGDPLHAAARLRRAAARADRRLRVLLPQRTRDAGLRPEQLRQAALSRDAVAVGPDRDQRPRGARRARHLRPSYGTHGGDRDRRRARGHRPDRAGTAVQLGRPGRGLQRAEPERARLVPRRPRRRDRPPRGDDLPDVRRGRRPLPGRLHPDAADADSVRAGQPFLGRITRHELSHVAIGVRDDGSPAWVSEGIAEYLGAREVPQRERIIPTSALNRARRPPTRACRCRRTSTTASRSGTTR